jgi:hypothetical protein
MEINVKDISFIGEEKITLRDGSILNGDIIDPQLVVMTRYGELKVNTKDIASIVFAEETLETETKAPAIAEENLPAPVIVEEPQNNKDYRTIAVAFDPLQYILGQASDMLILAGHKFVLGPIFLDPFAGSSFGSVNDMKYRGLRYGVNIGVCF